MAFMKQRGTGKTRKGNRTCQKCSGKGFTVNQRTHERKPCICVGGPSGGEVTQTQTSSLKAHSEQMMQMFAHDNKPAFRSFSQGEKWETQVRGRNYIVEVCDESGVPEMKALDDECFGGHQGISEEALREIQSRGALIAIRDPQTGRMVGESQVTNSAIADAEEPVLQVLPEHVGYLEGAAVAPSHRGMGLQGELQKLRMEYLRNEGKEAAVCTVRLENAPSVANLMNSGFVLAAEDVDYYGPADDPSSHRCVLVADLEAPAGGHVPEGGPRWTPGVLNNNPDVVRLVSENGDGFDTQARQGLSELLAAGYVGTGSKRCEEGHELVFVKKSSLSGHNDGISGQQVEKQQQWLAKATGTPPAGYGL